MKFVDKQQLTFRRHH